MTFESRDGFADLFFNNGVHRLRDAWRQREYSVRDRMILAGVWASERLSWTIAGLTAVGIEIATNQPEFAATAAVAIIGSRALVQRATFDYYKRTRV